MELKFFTFSASRQISRPKGSPNVGLGFTCTSVFEVYISFILLVLQLSFESRCRKQMEGDFIYSFFYETSVKILYVWIMGPPKKSVSKAVREK